MSTAKHTAEPWYSNNCQGRTGTTTVHRSDGVAIATCYTPEDAQRVKDCVNACAPDGPVTLALRAVAECDLVAFPSDLRLAARDALRALGS